jgi:mediator of RNA polymerase II transcription subunit 16
MSSNKMLERQPDLVTNKLVLSMQLMNHETLLAFVNSDGTIEYRDRGSWNIIDPSFDTAFTSSLPQAGFEYLAGDHNIHVAVSSDGAAMAVVRADEQMEAKTMTLRHTWQPLEDGIMDMQGVLETAIICVVRQHTMLANSNASTAEASALLPAAQLSPHLQQFARRETMRMLTRSYDLMGFDDKNKQQMLIRDPGLPKALSAQLALGMNPGDPNGEPALPAQLAWAVLNLKHVHNAIVVACTRPENINAVIMHSLRGLVRWAIDVYVLVLNALFEINTRTSNTKSAVQAAEEYTTEENSPAILLLLCSYSRAMLRFLAMYLPRYLKILQAVIPRSRSVLEKHQLSELLKHSESLPFRWDTVATLLGEVDKAVYEAFAQPNAQLTRTEMELDLLTNCIVPTALHSALETIVNKVFDKHRNDLDLCALLFTDTSWLHLNPSTAGGNTDALRKIPIPTGAKVRLCRRCNSKMEDLISSADEVRSLPPWLAAGQRQCVCTCSWYLP